MFAATTFTHGCGGCNSSYERPDDFYVTTGSLGVYRVDRTTTSNVLLAADNFSESNPVVWNGQLLFLERDVGVRRCVD